MSIAPGNNSEPCIRRASGIYNPRITWAERADFGSCDYVDHRVIVIRRGEYGGFFPERERGSVFYWSEVTGSTAHDVDVAGRDLCDHAT